MAMWGVVVVVVVVADAMPYIVDGQWLRVAVDFDPLFVRLLAYCSVQAQHAQNVLCCNRQAWLPQLHDRLQAVNELQVAQQLNLHPLQLSACAQSRERERRERSPAPEHQGHLQCTLALLTWRLPNPTLTSLHRGVENDRHKVVRVAVNDEP